MNFNNIALLVIGLLIAISASAAGDAAKAATMATQVCAACHNADGNSAVAMYPKLAGQHAQYLSKQLSNFKSGERKNAIMTTMAATLTPEDMNNLGAYFAWQKPKSGTAKSNGAGSIGEKIYRGGIVDRGVPACASCHGPSGAGIPVQFPRLSAQYAEYVATQLKTFRSGERANDEAMMMRMIAAKLSDSEIAAVADYVQGLH